jgi:hypothetical protein
MQPRPPIAITVSEAAAMPMKATPAQIANRLIPPSTVYTVPCTRADQGTYSAEQDGACGFSSQ